MSKLSIEELPYSTKHMDALNGFVENRTSQSATPTEFLEVMKDLRDNVTMSEILKLWDEELQEKVKKITYARLILSADILNTIGEENITAPGMSLDKIAVIARGDIEFDVGWLTLETVQAMTWEWLAHESMTASKLSVLRASAEDIQELWAENIAKMEKEEMEKALKVWETTKIKREIQKEIDASEIPDRLFEILQKRHGRNTSPNEFEKTFRSLLGDREMKGILNPLGEEHDMEKEKRMKQLAYAKLTLQSNVYAAIWEETIMHPWLSLEKISAIGYNDVHEDQNTSLSIKQIEALGPKTLTHEHMSVDKLIIIWFTMNSQKIREIWAQALLDTPVWKLREALSSKIVKDQVRQSTKRTQK